VSDLTVLMSIYNSKDYLEEAITSILNQTMNDFEFLIINDGSTDNSSDIIASFKDTRIKTIENPVNIGLTKSLNIGLKRATGSFIARQDADDISLPRRLEKQLSYLKTNPNIAVVGSWAKEIEADGAFLREIKTADDPMVLRWRMLFTNQIIHSTMMFRQKDILKLGGYNEEYRYSQDYDLWLKVLKKNDIYILPEFLVCRRKHKNYITGINFTEQNEAAHIIVHKNLSQYLKRHIDINDVMSLRELFHYRSVTPVSSHFRALILLLSAYQSFFLKCCPGKGSVNLIKQDLGHKIISIATMCSFQNRRVSLSVFINIFSYCGLFSINSESIKYLLKIIVGPKIWHKIKSIQIQKE